VRVVSAWFGGGNALSNWRPARCFVPESIEPEWFKGIFQASGTVGQVVRLDRAALSEAGQRATAERTGKGAAD
jgi:hypothetical protein